MNQIIRDYFDGVEATLINSPIVISYNIIRQEIALSDGKLRVKAVLIDGGTLELFEYVSESDKHISLLKYSFHWQDANGNLKRRWDNAPHYSNLPNSPHHVHYEDNSVREIMKIPDIFFIIKEIDKALG